VKRNFGTQGEDNTNQSGHSGYTTANRITENPRKTTRSRRYSNEELRRWGIPTPEEEALISDPHTFLDIAPYRRFITAPIQSLKGLLRSTAEGAILYWKKGDYIFDRTTKGNVPVWSTIARRYWKNQSIKEGAIDKWDVENVERMRNGLAPQRTNPRSGELESKELHHQPVPRSQGGGEFIEVWPEEHARIDPHRRLKKR
jgi:filamentous hemagglutinin